MSLRTVSCFGAHQNKKCCAAEHKMVRSKTSDGAQGAAHGNGLKDRSEKPQIREMKYSKFRSPNTANFGNALLTSEDGI